MANQEGGDKINNLMLIIRNSKNLLPASTNKISSPF